MDLVSPSNKILAPEEAKQVTVDIPLVKPDAPILKQVMEEFDFEKPPCDPKKLYTDLAESILKYRGLGLSASQLGLPYRVFVIWSDPIRAFFNPVIVDTSPETIFLDEGCLSFPGLFLNIERPRGVRLRFSNPLGERTTETFEDLTARIIQHEMDHLNGIVFGSRVTRMELEIAIRKAKKTFGHTYTVGMLR